MWLLIFVTVLVLWFFYLGHARLGARARPPRLVGDGEYAIEIVGENIYLASFERFAVNARRIASIGKPMRVLQWKATTGSLREQSGCRSRDTR